jgi:hypothetical protein
MGDGICGHRSWTRRDARAHACVLAAGWRGGRSEGNVIASEREGREGTMGHSAAFAWGGDEFPRLRKTSRGTTSVRNV